VITLQIQIGHTEGSSEEAGYDSRRLKRLDELFLGLTQQKKLQCASYLFSRNGKIFVKKSMGMLNGVTNEGDFMPDSIRRVASITKAFTAVTIMKLLEDGKLYLDQPVHTILEEFDNAMHKSITIFHLLTHTSGIIADPGYFNEPYPRGWWEGAENQSWIKRVLSGPLLCKPGESWNYSSSSFALLGEIISRVSGVPYEEYVCQVIIEPLGLKQTFFDVPEPLHNEVCIVTEWDDQRLKSNEPRTNLPPRAGGGLYSSMQDLWSFGQMLLNNGELQGQRIIGRKTVEAMTRNYLFGVPAFQWGKNSASIKYGLGLVVQNGPREILSPGTYSHGGAGRSELIIDPVEQFVAIFFVPTSLDWVPESVDHARNVIWSGIQ
jgi:CubicO group peptidase (beta-lactamase class C family)